SAFARFNTIITSLKAFDEGYSSKNYVRKFLRALHPKWRAKVMAVEETKDLTSLSLDQLIGNLKVHEVIIKKDSEIVKTKVERKSIALKAKKESSDKECSTSDSKDEEYVMAIRDFKKFFKNRCGDPNHLIGECLKPPKDKNQRAFVGGSWSDSGEEDDEKVKDKTCLVAHASSETKKVKESLNVTFDETPPTSKTSPLVDDELDEEEAIKVVEKKNLENDIVDETLEIDEIVNIKESRNHPLENVIGNLNQRTLRCKSAFQNGFINEEVYVAQPPGFIDFEKLNHVYKLKKALYGLKQALKACLEDSKPMKTPMSSGTKLTKDEECTTHLGLWYPNGTGIETVVYDDSDHARDMWIQRALAALYVREMLFDILVLEETNRSYYIYYRSQIPMRRKGMSTSTVDETSSHRL
nr:UBN2 domain-containing protein [Tanacetum cinerariifolium]